MKFVNKIKTKDGQEYDIQDKRLIATAEDVGKVLTVNEEGNLEFKEASGGTKLYKHEVNAESSTGSGNQRLIFISTISTPFSNVSSITNNKDKIVKSLYVPFTGSYDIGNAYDIVGLGSAMIYVNGSSFSSISIQETLLNDTVTEL